MTRRAREAISLFFFQRIDVRTSYAHGEADVGLFQGGTVVGAVTGDSHDLAIRRGHAVNYALDEGVLVRGRGARKHAQLRPDLVQKVLLNLAVSVANPPVKLLALQDQEVLAWLYDAALQCD